MNFIRNIIAEKRNSKAHEVDLPHSEPVFADDPAPAKDHLNAMWNYTSPATEPPIATPVAAIEVPDINIFSDEEDDTELLSFEPDFDERADPFADERRMLAAEPELNHSAVSEIDGLGGQPAQPLRIHHVANTAAHNGDARLTSDALPMLLRNKLPSADAFQRTELPAPPKMPEGDLDEERRLRRAYLIEEETQAVREMPEVEHHAPPEATTESLRRPTLHDMPFVEFRPDRQPEDLGADAKIAVPPPAGGRGTNRSGRVKTRLLGFNPATLGPTNAFETETVQQVEAFPVGWLVVVEGPGLGTPFALHDGVARIGRGDDQTICLNFGDNSISRENHLSIAFDTEQSAFYIGQSGRSNIVRLNKKPLLSTEKVTNGDQIRVGETTLRLVTLCGDDFTWARKS
ncbi:MAG: FHA domain-containing protein [bacterium]